MTVARPGSSGRAEAAMRTTRVTTVSHLLLLATVALPALALLVVLIAAFAAYAVDDGHSDVGLGLVFVSPLLVIGVIAALEAVSVWRAGAARASHVLVVAVGMLAVLPCHGHAQAMPPGRPALDPLSGAQRMRAAVRGV
jgi:hypothetical protein